MKKKLLSALLCTAMVATMAAGCGSSGGSDKEGSDSGSDSGKKTYAIVTKAQEIRTMRERQADSRKSSKRKAENAS